MDPFIYGKDQTERVVSVEPEDHYTMIFTEDESGVYKRYVKSNFWILYHNDGDGRIRLNGTLHYKYGAKYSTREEYQQAIKTARITGEDYYTMWNPKEQFLVKEGVTYFKGMKPEDVSVLSFDIETTSLDPKNGDILLISNTYRKNGKIERKLFAYDEYDNQKELVDAWCKYVRTCDPSILLGHNIFGFDLPYLKQKGKELDLGRDGSKAKFARRDSQFRKDGSQTYSYRNVTVYGREIVDTFFLAIKYDFKRLYPSYGLKAIIEHEGLEKEGRIKWDFEKYKPIDVQILYERDGNNLLWDKFQEYCEDDSDDALKLFDLMIPAYFYYNQSIPKSFQEIINRATGSQVNSFLVRSYLSEHHSIPKADEPIKYKGALTFGNPGIYKNCFKIDVARMYPSIIMQHEIFDKDKDPKAHLLKMTKVFTKMRDDYKELYVKTGDSKYLAMSEAFKIVCNSIYGLLNAPGLNFNAPPKAEIITGHGRDIVTHAMEWATGESV